MYYFDEHTADVKLIAEGNSFDEAFQYLLEGVVSLIKGTPKGKELRIKRRYRAKFEEDLIIGTIEDLIYLIETKNIVPKIVKLKNIDSDKLVVDYEIIGNKGEVENIIKAPTYHQLKIEKGDKYRIEVVLDV